MRRIMMLVLLACLCISQAGATLILEPLGGALGGRPGEVVGWGFTLTSDPVNDNGTIITPWLVVSAADFELDPGFFPVGIFTPYIQNTFQVVGPDTGNGELNPWTQAFDPDILQVGLGEYAINSFQSAGDLAQGRLVLIYDSYRRSPNDPAFNPVTDTIANGLRVSARASVAVVPEASMWAPALACFLVAGIFRRRKGDTLP